MSNYLGVYAGPGPDGVMRASMWGDQFGIPLVYHSDHVDWTSAARARWTIPYVLGSHAAGPFRPLEMVLGLLPREERTAGMRLSDVAAGALDPLWQYAGEQIGAAPFPVWLRLGHEPNGDPDKGGYPWAFGANPEPYVAAFRHVVGVLRGAALAANNRDHLQITWCVANGRHSVSPAPDLGYPGDDVVETIGVDIYDRSWRYARDGIGKPVRDTVWCELTAGDLVTSRRGAEFWRQFATDHGKSFAVPEWGVTVTTSCEGGGDNPAFIERMMEWMSWNDVAWSGYFEAHDDKVDHRLMLDDTLTFAASGDALRNWADARTLRVPGTARRPVWPPS